MMNEIMDEIKKLAEHRNQLAKLATQQYEPVVFQIIANNNRDKQQIERTLDYMLDFCFDNEMLQLYRKLCRHLYHFNPESAVSYINAYREMWDEDGIKFGNSENPE